CQRSGSWAPPRPRSTPNGSTHLWSAYTHTTGLRAALYRLNTAGRKEVMSAPEIAAEFVRMKVDVIVTSSTPNTLATKKATSEIPIIFASAGDPVGGGLVASLARPGGNVTGLSIQGAEITGKRIQLLREALHPLSRLAIMGNGDNSAVAAEMR